jgi:hypothetical protein
MPSGCVSFAFEVDASFCSKTIISEVENVSTSVKRRVGDGMFQVNATGGNGTVRWQEVGGAEKS